MPILSELSIPKKITLCITSNTLLSSFFRYRPVSDVTWSSAVEYTSPAPPVLLALYKFLYFLILLMKLQMLSNLIWRRYMMLLASTKTYASVSLSVCICLICDVTGIYQDVCISKLICLYLSNLLWQLLLSYYFTWDWDWLNVAAEAKVPWDRLLSVFDHSLHLPHLHPTPPPPPPAPPFSPHRHLYQHPILSLIQTFCFTLNAAWLPACQHSFIPLSHLSSRKQKSFF